MRRRQTLRVTHPHKVHMERRYTGHALKGLKSVEGHLRATRDELQELGVFLLVEGFQDLE